VPAALGSDVPGHGGGRRGGGKGQRGAGVRFPSHLVLRRGEEAGQREQAAAALAVCGGGAGSLGEERAMVVGDEGLEGDAGVYL